MGRSAGALQLDGAWAAVERPEDLAPELAPAPADAGRRTRIDGVHIPRLSTRRERSRWGLIPTLRGVEALRGYCISKLPIMELQILLDGQVIDKAPVQSFPLESPVGGQWKYVFNAWVDFSRFEAGLHRMTLRFMAGPAEVRSHVEHVVVAPRRTEADFPDSDGVVEVSVSDPRSVEAQIRAHPSMVRSARRSLLARPPRKILVLRTDQLGDLVVSIPALRRLREIFAEARIVGLLTPANAELAQSLQLFDEIVVIDFPEDEQERRRTMPMDAQKALRDRLGPYRFDLAIDLGLGAASRPLLLLSGARFLYGFEGDEWPWLSAGFRGGARDSWNGNEATAHSNRLLALIEPLAGFLGSKAEVVRPSDLSPSLLVPLGLAVGAPYAVLHAGARLAFSRWPHFPQLAALVLERTDLRVVLVTDGSQLMGALPESLVASDRLTLLDGRLPFNTFDALLSFCAVFVGNDSGPKHLAALRGSPVVSVHSSRINWNEWGQEASGSIISRRVPCAGCGLSYDDNECGKDFSCIRDISVEEVFSAMTQLLERPQP
jgi:ADP-heptose:LPS heptosyltransferase